MKKIALIFGLIILFFLSSPQAEAACVPKQESTPCTKQWDCTVSVFHAVPYCCDAREECVQNRAAQSLCDFVSDQDKDECESCFSNGRAWTAIGCIPTTASGFIGKFLGLGVGIAGGIAFLLILFGGLQILTSAGNPEKLNAGREVVSAAISGLILIIFSIFLLRLIGVNILQLPEFGPT